MLHIPKPLCSKTNTTSATTWVSPLDKATWKISSHQRCPKPFDHQSWWFWTTVCVSDFFFSLRTTCLGITSNRKLPPFHIVAETLSIWKTACNSYERNMGTVSAMVATVNMACKRAYISMRFGSPSTPLRRHHILFAFWAFLESSLWNNEVIRISFQFRAIWKIRRVWMNNFLLPVRSHDLRVS